MKVSKRNKLKSITSKIFEPPKNRNAYVPYTDSEGNVLGEDDIQFTDMDGFRGRRSMLWNDDENGDETYTVLSDNVEPVYDEAGNLIHHSTTNFTETFTNGDQGAGADPTFLTTTVINRKGFTLPRTGGFGTLLFSGIGALLVVGGVGVLMGTKKKKDNA